MKAEGEETWRAGAETQKDHNAKRQRTEGRCQHMAQRSSRLLCNDCSAGSDGSQWTCIILPTDPSPPTWGDKLWREERDTCDFIYITLMTPPNRRTARMTVGDNFAKVRWRKRGKLQKPLVFLFIYSCFEHHLKTDWGSVARAGFAPDTPDRWTEQIRHIEAYQTRQRRSPSGVWPLWRTGWWAGQRQVFEQQGLLLCSYVNISTNPHLLSHISTKLQQGIIQIPRACLCWAKKW